MTTESNPKNSNFFQFLSIVKVIVLFIAGAGLYFAPKLIGPLWPWELLPFNARFLGAVYSAACIAAVMQTIYARWSPARLVTPMIFIFTGIMIVLSFVYLDKFDFQNWVVWVWFFLYLLVPINAAYHIWLNRNLPPVDSMPLSNSARKIILLQAIILGLYGSALIFIPSIAKLIWPWEIDNFHTQLYSVTFITPALGAYLLTKGGSKIEWQTMGMTQVVLGLFPIVGLIIVDTSAKRVLWSAPGTWIWLTLFTGIFIIGIWIINEAKKK